MSFIVVILSGAVTYWIPVILAFALCGPGPLVIANMGAIVFTSVGYVALRKIFALRFTGLWLLVGIYVFGPLLQQVAFTFVGGGFSRPLAWTDIGWLTLSSVFPPMFLLFAGDGGLLPSLLPVTIYFIYAASKTAARQKS